MLYELGICIVILMCLAMLVIGLSEKYGLKWIGLVGIAIFVISIMTIWCVLPEGGGASNIDIIGNLDDSQVYYAYNVSISRNHPDIAVLVVQKVDVTTGTFFGRICLYKVPKAELPDGLETPEKIIYRNNNIEIWTQPF